MKTKKIILTILGLFFFMMLLGQQDQPIRKEIDVDDIGDNDYMIIPTGSNGLILFYENTDKKIKGQQIMQFTRYDTKLKKVWDKQIPLKKNISYTTFFYDTVRLELYTLFDDNKDISIISLNVKDGSFRETNSILPVSLDIKKLQIISNTAFISGKTTIGIMDNCINSCFTYLTCFSPFWTGYLPNIPHPMIFTIDLDKGLSKTIPLMYKGRTEINDLQIKQINNKPVISASIVNRGKEPRFDLNYYNEKGETVKSVKIKAAPDKLITSAEQYYTEDQESIIIGTYDNWTGKGKNKLKDISSVGMYFSKFHGAEQKVIKYYSFIDFKSLNESFSKRTQKNINKKKAKGKEVFINYQLLIHDLIIRNDEYIMVAEAYYPEYERHCYTTYSPQGGTQTHCYSVFVGWRYTNAIVAAFNEEGKMIWDHNFEIWDILTFNLKERVKILTYDDSDELLLTYAYSGKIESKIISGKNVVQGDKSTKIETQYSDDKIKGNYQSDFEFWYDNYFLTWGYQRIKSNEAKKATGEKKRNVFYFNKIEY